MKRLMCGLIAALVVACLTSVSARSPIQNPALDFTLINQTGLTIVELYLSPTTEDTWGDDVLGLDVLEDEKKVDIAFSPKARTCNWDLKIVDEDDDEVVWEKLNLCEAVEITLLYEKGGKPTAVIK